MEFCGYCPREKPKCACYTEDEAVDCMVQREIYYETHEYEPSNRILEAEERAENWGIQGEEL